MLWTFDYPRFSARCHARFGPTFTVRIGGLPTAVVTTDGEAMRRLFTGDPLTKRHGNDLLRPVLGEHSLLLLEPPSHLERRKLLLPPFHGERIRAYAALMERLVAAELDRWRAGQVVRVHPFAASLTLDVILQAVLGIDEPATRRWLRRTFDAVTKPANNLAIYVPRLMERRRWNVFAEPYWRRWDELHALLLEHIAATRSDPALAQRDDVLAVLVQASDGNGSGLSDAELRDELITLILAGHETTATAIAWAAELLVHNQDVLTRARAAADEGDDEYLDALVKEVLRIRQPVPVAAARYSLEPLAIGPWTIGPDTTIIIDGWGIHHDPATYSQPEAFRPERFLESNADAYTFLPFGGGAHRCLGAPLAQLEMKVVLRAILERFELAPARRSLAAMRRRGITLAPQGGGVVRVVRERAPARRELATA
jgi:cytochrome P450